MPPQQMTDGEREPPSAAALNTPPRIVSSSKPVSPLSPLPTATIEPEVGGEVFTPFGRGKVLQVRTKSIKVRLVNWKLANQSPVICVFTLDNVTVLSSTKSSKMNIAEQVQYATALKTLAAQLQSAKKYGAALDVYNKLLSVVSGLLTNLNKTERADWLVQSVKCNNHEATCCLVLELYSRALDCAKDALLVLDALEKGKAEDDNNLQALGQVKLFGECRVKSLLLMAEALIGLQERHAARKIIDQAYKNIFKYTTRSSDYIQTSPEYKPVLKHLVSYHRQAKKLKRQTRNNKIVAIDEKGNNSSWFRRRKVWFGGATTHHESDDDSVEIFTQPWYKRPETYIYGSVVIGAAVAVQYVWRNHNRK